MAKLSTYPILFTALFFHGYALVHIGYILQSCALPEKQHLLYLQTPSHLACILIKV